MSEIVLPESAKPVQPPDLDYHIRRLRRRAAHNRNEVGDILLPDDVIMDGAADALEWAKAKLEAMERIGDAGREVYNDWMSGKDADELTASWPAIVELHEALAAA
mgnify:CR=1 FL=1